MGITKKTLIQLGIIAFFIGIIAAEIISMSEIIITVVILLIFCLVGKKQKFSLLYITTFFCLGIIRLTLTIPWSSDHIVNWTNQTTILAIEGRIVNDPEISNNKQSFILEASVIDYKNRLIKTRGRVQIKADLYPVYSFGEVLRIEGKLEKPESNGPFSYEKYLAKDNIWAVINRAKIKILPSINEQFNDKYGFIAYFWKSIFNFKHFFQNKIEALFSAPDAGIVLGLLLGLRATIPEDIQSNFQRTGLTHILAISGYNITLLINIITIFCGSMDRKKRTIITIIIISFFAIITGLSASVVRASIMGILVVGASAFGKKTQGLQLLLLSAFFMTVQNPRILLWDISFQLSFLSTLGLLVLMPKCEKWFGKWPELLRENLPVTLAATIFTTPITLYYFGTFSFISLLTNIVFLPLIPLIMLCSFSALMLYFLFEPIGQISAGLNWILMRFLLDGVKLFAALPFAAVKMSTFPLWSVATMYGGIFLSIHYKIVSLGLKELMKQWPLAYK